MRAFRWFAVVVLAGILPCQTLPAQQSRTPPVRPDSAARDSAAVSRLQPVSITVARDRSRSPFDVPYAASTVAPDAIRPSQRRQSVGDLLFGVPGVMVQERANPSQDARLAIRGFGARSAFGVRGVRVLRDGLPLSLPDGQTPIDWLELESVGTMEVIRGTAAALYGNAAGGVVNFRSADPVNAPLSVRSRWWNDGGVSRGTITMGGMLPSRSAAVNDDAGAAAPVEAAITNVGGVVTATRSSGAGYRQWSASEATHLFARTLATVKGTRLEVQGTYYDSPRAENTGALTATELSRDPRLPDSLNIVKHSRKAVTHQQIALLAERGNDRVSMSASAFAASRALDNPLAFAIVAVDRAVAGASVQANYRTMSARWPMRLTTGVDVQRQDDSRLNYENCADYVGAVATAKCPVVGQERGARRIDQREQVRGFGSYIRAEVETPHRFLLSAALRHDRVGFTVTDRFISATNADDSGDQSLSATTPMVGIVWRARPMLSVFANWTSAFETPTITELTNQEDGAAGLNARLLPQRTQTVESGMQMLIGNRLRWDVAAFRAVVLDELVPFDVPNSPGRRAFRNAGQSSRRGVETSVMAVLPHAEIGASYTRSHFRFDTYQVGANNFAGQTIPGVPGQFAQLWGTAHLRDVFGTVETTLSSSVNANDAGTVTAAGYSVWSLRAGYAARAISNRLRVQPTVGVDNVFDRRFATSVVVNATRNRYFEPGLPRRVFVSVTVSGQ